MIEIKERVLKPEYQTVYKYVSDDGKFTSKFQWDVEQYEKQQGEPYFKDFINKIAELKNYVNENKQNLQHFKNCQGNLEELILYLLLRNNNAKDCYVDIYSSGGDSWKLGDF